MDPIVAPGKADLDIWYLVVASELFVSEHGQNPDTVFKASWAAPGKTLIDRLLNTSHPDNHSGISFGIVQLDIGSGNAFAVQAYRDILSNALDNGQITQSGYNHLLTYIGKNRAEIQNAYSADTQSQNQFVKDMKLLNALFVSDFAKEVIQSASLGQTQTIVDAFFTGSNALYDTMYQTWGDNGHSAFSSSNPDYYRVMAVLIATKNRQGSLGGALVNYLQTHEITNLEDLREAYRLFKPSLLDDESGGWFDRIANEGGAAAEQMALQHIATLPTIHCFPSGTSIQTSYSDHRPIETISIGDEVLSFDPRSRATFLDAHMSANSLAQLSSINAPLIPARVTRLFTNVTNEWLIITPADGETQRTGIEPFKLTVTPGHEMLDAFGRFRKVIDIVKSVVRYSIKLTNLSVQLLWGKFYARGTNEADVGCYVF